MSAELWFEYHCWESLQSSDAHLWARTHSRLVSAVHDPSTHDCIADEAPTALERGRDYGQPCYLIVTFEDGFVADATEDEVVSSPAEFECRPCPYGEGIGAI